MSESETDLHALRQRQFNAVWDWFVVQGKPQSRNGNGCRYRGSDDARCGVGVLIPDELYTPSIEGWMVMPILECSTDRFLVAISRALGGPANHEFLVAIQGAHDWHFDSMVFELRGIADRYNLTVPA